MPSDEQIEVNPLPEHEETETFREKTLDASPPADEREQAPSSDAAETAKESPTEPESPSSDAHADEESKESRRQRLIDALTNADNTEGGETPEPGDADATHDKADDAAPSEEKDDADLQEVTNDTVREMKPGEARRKINKLIGRVKAAESLAAGYKEIVSLCQENGFSPDDYKAWVRIGIGLQKGDQQAIEALRLIGQRAGVVPAVDTASLDTLLKELVESVDVSEEAAQKIREFVSGGKQSTQAQMVPVTPAPQAPPPAAPVPQAAPAIEQRTAAAIAELDRVSKQYRQKLGEARWKEIQPALIEAMKPKAGAPPEAWSSIYEAEIEKLVARGAAKPISPGLRPSTTAGNAKPQFKSERERVIHRLLNEE